MVLSGHVKNGTIVLDEPLALPEGTAVSVAIAPQHAADSQAANGTIWEAFARASAAIPPAELARLPVDGAAKHDQYLGKSTHGRT